MTTKPAPHKRPTGAVPGVNGLIAAIAVAATLGGWTVLASAPAETAAIPAATQSTMVSAAPVLSAPVQTIARPEIRPATTVELRRVSDLPAVVTRSSR